MLYLPFNVYLDSKRVSILIEAVLLTFTNGVPSLEAETIFWKRENKNK